MDEFTIELPKELATAGSARGIVGERVHGHPRTTPRRDGEGKVVWFEFEGMQAA